MSSLTNQEKKLINDNFNRINVVEVLESDGETYKKDYIIEGIGDVYRKREEVLNKYLAEGYEIIDMSGIIDYYLVKEVRGFLNKRDYYVMIILLK